MRRVGVRERGEHGHTGSKGARVLIKGHLFGYGDPSTHVTGCSELPGHAGSALDKYLPR